MSRRQRSRTAAGGFLGALAALLLGGCATLIKSDADGDWITIQPGSTLTLNRAVSIPENRARLFFVNGRARRSGASYRPACALEVRRISRDGPQRIPPGEIAITRVQHYWTEVADARDTDAAAFRLADYGGDDGGGYSMIQTGYHLWLDGGADGNLMRLTCLGVLADPAEAYPPTVAEIRAALGEHATLDLVSAPR